MQICCSVSEKIHAVPKAKECKACYTKGLFRGKATFWASLNMNKTFWESPRFLRYDMKSIKNDATNNSSLLREHAWAVCACVYACISLAPTAIDWVLFIFSILFIQHRSVPGEYGHFTKNRGPSGSPKHNMVIVLKTALLILITFQ